MKVTTAGSNFTSYQWLHLLLLRHSAFHCKCSCTACFVLFLPLLSGLWAHCISQRLWALKKKKKFSLRKMFPSLSRFVCLRLSHSTKKDTLLALSSTSTFVNEYHEAEGFSYYIWSWSVLYKFNASNICIIWGWLCMPKMAFKAKVIILKIEETSIVQKLS